MPRAILILALLLTTGTPRLHAQADFFLRAGAVGASRLLRDFVTEPIEVRQSIAPMIALGGSLPIGPGFRAGLEATVASGAFHSKELGAETDLGTLRTGSLTAFLEGPVWQELRWHVGLGGITYWPADDAGIFARGGDTRLLAVAGADWRRAIHPRWDVIASGRYDYHRFTTDELRARGFSHSQAVSRVSLSIGLARGLR